MVSEIEKLEIRINECKEAKPPKDASDSTKKRFKECMASDIKRMEESLKTVKLRLSHET